VFHDLHVTVCNVQPEAPSVPAILAAGRALLESRQPGEVSMASVAAASGYSRMAVYRHFGSRAGLLTALLAHIDAVEGAEAAVRGILRAESPEQVVDELFAWWSRYVPRFAGVARGVLATKHADDDLQAAWDERMRALRSVCAAVSRRCVQDRRAAAAFADQLWVLLSVPLWLQLSDDGWSRARYARTMAGLARAALPG
jgi:AcrR family transcriptional regulator